MMKDLWITLFFLMLIVTGCRQGNKVITVENPTALIENLVNHSVIKKENISDYIDKNKNEDITMIEMVQEYNEGNTNVFSDNQVKIKKYLQRLIRIQENLLK
jgi:hypothetical protein